MRTGMKAIMFAMLVVLMSLNGFASSARINGTEQRSASCHGIYLGMDTTSLVKVADRIAYHYQTDSDQVYGVLIGSDTIGVFVANNSVYRINFFVDGSTD